MWTVLIVLLVVWVVLSIVGFAFEGLFWLGLIGIVLFASTAVVVANILVDLAYAVLDPRVRIS